MNVRGGPHSPFHVRAGERRAPLIFTVEHASAAVPEEYAGLGLGPVELADHVAEVMDGPRIRAPSAKG